MLYIIYVIGEKGQQRTGRRMVPLSSRERREREREREKERERREREREPLTLINI